MAEPIPDLTTPEGNLFTDDIERAATPGFTQALARNRDAIDREIRETAESALEEVQTTRGAVVAATNAAQDAAGSAEASAQSAAQIVPRMEQIEAMAGLAPGEVTDAQTANLISRSDTTTRTALTTATAQVTGVMTATGMVPDGTTDASVALRNAMAATPDGMTLRVPEGTYRIGSTPVVSGKNITIDLRGVTLRPDPGIPALSLAGSYGAILPVTATAATTVTVGDVTWPATDITVSGTPLVQTGDVMKIVADDPIPGVRPGSGTSESRIGEFVVVHTVTGSTIRVMGRLREVYATNVRIGKLNRHNMEVRGGVVEYPTTTTPGAAILVRDLIRPIINGTVIERCPSAAMQFIGCYGYVVSNAVVAHAVDNPGTGNFGYGIMDNASAFGKISGYHARHVRHAYTDDTPRIAANTGSLSNYGRTYGNVISDSHAHGTHMTAWDTHGSAEQVTFADCTATNCAQGFGLRGNRHKILNCSVDGAAVALALVDEADGVETYGITVDGFTFRRITGTPIRYVLRYTGHPQAGVRETRPSYFSNIRGAVSSEAQNGFIEARRCTIHMRNVHATLPPSTPWDAALIKASDAVVQFSGFTADYLLHNAVADRLTIVGAVGNATVEGNDLRVLSTSAQAARVMAISKTATDTVILRGVVMDYLLKSSVVAGDQPVYEYLALQSQRTSESIFQASTAGIAVNVSRTLQDVTVTFGGGSVTLPDLMAGKRVGQMLTVANAGTGTVSINTGGTTLVGASANFTLARYQSARFVWDGALWTRVA